MQQINQQMSFFPVILNKGLVKKASILPPHHCFYLSKTLVFQSHLSEGINVVYPIRRLYVPPPLPV